MRVPYLAALGRFGEVSGWLVDGEWIRNRLDIDFTNGAHHFVRPYVPKDEVWIDREAPGAGEIPFLVRHQIRQRLLMLSGVSYLAALARCNRLERRERRAALASPVPIGAEARAKVRLYQLADVEGDQFWLVDGKGVRDLFDPNFTEGGHALRYRFIPRREIWIDNALVEQEREFVFAHELHELELMRNGVDYDAAHERALELERVLRRIERSRLVRPSRSIAALPVERRRRAG
jgi:hypothetical protein